MLNVRLHRSFASFGAVTLIVACAKFEAADEGPGTGPDGGSDGGPPPAAEDCVDGRDENGDGNPDCAEPTCLPHARCVPSPTTLGAWEGYSTLVDEGPCPSELPTSVDAFRADTDKPQCGACSCEAKTSCDMPVIVTEGAIDCQQGLLTFEATPDQCSTISKTALGYATRWSVPSTGGTTCAAITSGETVMPTAKYRPVKVCTGVGRFGVGCPTGQVCAKRTKLCVSKAVEADTREVCPPDFPIAEIVLPKDGDPEAAFVDDRSCTACTCAPAIGGGCDRTLALYGQNGCGGAAGPVVKSGSCETASCGGGGCNSGRLTVTARPGTCGKGQAAPKGGVKLTSAGRQYCCNAP